MKKVLIPVDDSKGSLASLKVFQELFSSENPASVVLLYVEKMEGRSLMDDMLGKAELSTLKEASIGKTGVYRHKNRYKGRPSGRGDTADRKG
jgi:hypothetical protein